MFRPGRLGRQVAPDAPVNDDIADIALNPERDRPGLLTAILDAGRDLVGHRLDLGRHLHMRLRHRPVILPEILIVAKRGNEDARTALHRRELLVVACLAPLAEGRGIGDRGLVLGDVLRQPVAENSDLDRHALRHHDPVARAGVGNFARLLRDRHLEGQPVQLDLAGVQELRDEMTRKGAAPDMHARLEDDRVAERDIRIDRRQRLLIDPVASFVVDRGIAP